MCVYRCLSSNNAEIAIARMKIVIATKIRFTAESKPPVTLISVLLLCVVRKLPLGVDGLSSKSFNSDTTIHMTSPITSMPANAIPIIRMTPRSIIPSTFSQSFRNILHPSEEQQCRDCKGKNKDRDSH